MKGSRNKGIRADRLVKERFPGLTGRHVDEALDSGLVRTREGKRVAKGARFATIEQLDLSRLEIHLASLREGDPHLKVPLVRDFGEYLLVDKPAGVPAHPLGLFDFHTLTHWAFARFPELRDRFPGVQPALTPHRLDTGTTGVQIVAKSPEEFDRWRRRFSEKKLRKRYLAWCWGNPREQDFEVTDSLAHDSRDERRMVLALGEGGYRAPVLPARTRFRVKRRIPEKGVCLMEADCETGATHQVRVHLASRDLPLVGDALYDPRFATRFHRPEHHWLRATVLTGGPHPLRVPTDAFENRLPELIPSPAGRQTEE